MLQNIKTEKQKILLLGLVFLILWVPRGLELDRYVTTDEPSWLVRSANFYRALYKTQFKETFQREHPGVTTTWIGTMGFVWRYPGYVKLATDWMEGSSHLQIFLGEHNKTPMELLEAGRVLMVLVIASISGISFLYLVKLIGLYPALLGFLFIAFDPFSISHSRLLHLDGLVSVLMLLSLLSFISYLYSGRKLIDLLISGAAAGLSWLTKSPALFLAPFIFLLVLISLVQSWRKKHRLQSRDYWQAVKPYLIWLFLASFVFVILWPAMWVNPIETIMKVFNLSSTYAFEGHDRQIFFNGSIYKSGISEWYFYPITYLWRATPVVLTGFGITLTLLVFRDKLKFSPERQRVASILILFSLLYTVLITIGSKKFDRYLLPIYAPLDIVAAIGWLTLLQAIQDRFPTRFPRRKLLTGSVLFLSAIVFVQFSSVIQTYPYYLNYYNPLLGGSKKAKEVMMIGWGEGLDQAAEYLNNLHEAESLQVVSWYKEGCFSYFFKGTSYGMGSESTLEDLKNADYIVVYIHQWQRQLPSPEVLAYFDGLSPEYTVQLGDLDYATIYDMRLTTDPDLETSDG